MVYIPVLELVFLHSLQVGEWISLPGAAWSRLKGRKKRWSWINSERERERERERESKREGVGVIERWLTRFEKGTSGTC